MTKFARKSVLFRFISVLTFVVLLCVPLLPALAGTQAADCDDECNDRCESVCGCIGCPPVTLACVVPLPEHAPTQNLLAYSIISPSTDIEREFFDRVERPPQKLL